MTTYQRIMAIIAALLIGVLAITIVTTVSAQSISVRVVAVRGENMLPTAQTKRLVQEALRYINNACWMDTKLVRFETRKNPMPWIKNGLADRITILRAWEAWFERSKTDIRLAVLPPLRDQGQYWIAGYATGVCRRGGVAYSTAEPKNMQGYSRVIHSATAMRHELGHLLGARDRTGSGLMDTGVLYQIGSAIPALDARSQYEIVKCAGRW